MTREEIGGRIRQLRIQAGISQERAAAHAGVSRITWQRYETGEDNPSAQRIPAVAAALDAPIAAIFRADAIADLTLSDETRARLLADPQAATTLAHDLAARIVPALLATLHHQATPRQAPSTVALVSPLVVAERLLASRQASVAIAAREVERLRRAQTVE